MSGKINIGGDNRVGGDQSVGGDLNKTVEAKSNLFYAIAFIIVSVGLAGAAGVAINFRGAGVEIESDTVGKTQE